MIYCTFTKMESNWRLVARKIPSQRQPARKHNSYPEKISFGVALCRRRAGKIEVLLVCKRYTYAYGDFVNGKYNSNDNDAIIKLLNQMTIDEKLDLLSLNFQQIWYRIWFYAKVNTSHYYVAKNKFETTFAMDQGKRLLDLISKSTHSPRIWEIPKGRRKKYEPSIHCAIRELQEETGIGKKSYQIFPRASRTVAFISNGHKYINTYFIAYAKYNIDVRLNFRSRDQLDEVSDMQWMGINEIRTVDPTGRLERLVRPIFNFIRKNTRSDEIIRPPRSTCRKKIK